MNPYRSDRAVHRPQRRDKNRLDILLGGLLLVALCADSSATTGGPSRPAPTRPTVSQPARPTCRHARRPMQTPLRAPSPAAGAHDERGVARPAPTKSRRTLRRPAVVATVNTQRITREDLARECRRSYGKEVLESMVNKHLIVAGMPAARDQRYAGRSGRRNRTHGQAVRHSRSTSG